MKLVDRLDDLPQAIELAASEAGAAFGDALCNVLAFVGYEVTREYYVNDAGAQVDILARSAFLRYREALGEDIGPIPEGLYPGDGPGCLITQLADCL